MMLIWEKRGGTGNPVEEAAGRGKEDFEKSCYILGISFMVFEKY